MMKLLAIIVLLVLAPLLRAEPQNQLLQVIDDLGNSISLQRPAQRVVALAPHLVEVVYAVGGGESLVGAVNYSNYPDEAINIPRVGSYKNFSVEAVMRLQPDLILAWHNSTAIAKVKKLQSLGFKVYWNDPKTLDGVSKSLVDIGRLLGAEQASAQSATFDQTLRDLRKTYAHKSPVSVFYQVWNEPLQTLNGEHLISDVMAVCGGVNVFADVNVRAPKISVEALLRANPQVIIASGMGEARPEWLDEWRNWPQLHAYQHQQLHFIPPALLQRHTPRILQGATLMCQQLDQARQAYTHYE
jgi:iron complex transport system substrate-binding protein